MIVLLSPDLDVSKNTPAIERRGLRMGLILKEVNLDWKRALDLIEDPCIPSFRHRPALTTLTPGVDPWLTIYAIDTPVFI